MGNNSAWGRMAYKEAKKNGGSIEDAKNAQRQADESYWSQTKERQFGKSPDYDNDVSDFGNSINDGAWHTAEDL
jgi:hypothetical protein